MKNLYNEKSLREDLDKLEKEIIVLREKGYTEVVRHLQDVVDHINSLLELNEQRRNKEELKR